MKNKEPIRIAHIMGKMVGGGVEAVVMNYYRHIDKEKIQFDFLIDRDSTNIPYQEIKSLGGNVIIIPPYQKLPQYLKELTKIFKENDYKIVHSHINTLSIFPLYAAKKCNIPIRIAHSHSTSNKKEYKKNFLKNFLRPFSKKYATNYFACTEHAGRWLFGNKEYDNGNVYILNNAIDLDKFKYNEKIRIKKRKELNIENDTLVIGHIGRFVAQKNHTFLIDIFNELHKKKKNSILLLIGQGPLIDEIKQKVEMLGLSDSVKFLGQRDDVNELYNVMDLFLFPSLYEGLGMVLIEAQANGLSCIASTEVPRIVKISKDVSFLELRSSINIWRDEIIKMIGKKNLVDINILIEKGYDIKNESIKLIKKYKELYKVNK